MSRLRTAWAALTGQPVQLRATTYQDVWGTGGDVDLLRGDPLSLVPLYSAIRLIADQFAAAPLDGFRMVESVPQKLDPAPALLSPAVPGMSRATWKTQIILGLLTRGNAVGIHTGYGRDGWPTSTVWVPTSDCWCDEDNPARPRFYYLGRELEPGEFVHIPWITPPGRVWGLSPLAVFKNLWETGAAAQLLARNFYDSGGVPSGHFKNTAQVLAPDQAEGMKARFKKAVRGRDVLVTGSDWDYNAIGLPADQLAFVSSIKLTATQIAGIYGLAPEDIGGEAAAGLQYSTVEMNEIKLSTRTMRPWYSRVEDGLNLHTPRTQFFHFDADAGVRADLMTRVKAHEVQTRVGLEDQPEARLAEGKPPMTDEQFARWQATYGQAKAAPTEEPNDPATRGEDRT